LVLRKELGRTGIRIPEVGLGTWSYTGGPAPLRTGFEGGAVFVDTAESYGTEAVVGAAVGGFPERVFIATKVSAQHLRPADVRSSVEKSLRQLNIDTIDLLQVHEPNPAIPISDTMGAFSDLVRAGKIRFIGVSNFSVPELEAARTAAQPLPIVSNQVRFNVVDRTIENGLLGYCQAHAITVIAYSPLAREFGRVRDADPEGVIAEISRVTGRTPAQIVLNWCLCRENVVVIPKGTSEAHVMENCGASGWRLAPEHLRMLDERIRHRRRGAFDRLVRRYTPRSLRGLAVGAARRLPRTLRRRVT
jgi:diketogulonate reductase-like aldo/keto reductase